MAERSGRANIGEAARELVSATKDGMEAIRIAQGTINQKLDAVRKLEQVLVRQAREKEEIERREQEEAAALLRVQEEETEKPTVETEQPVVDLAPQQIEEQVPVPEELKQTETIEIKVEEKTMTEGVQEVQAAGKPLEGETAQKSEPSVPGQTPPRRAPRTDLLNRPIRDDAARRNATRVGVPQSQSRPTGQRGQGDRTRTQEGRPQRPQGDRPGYQGQGDRNQGNRPGQRGTGTGGNRPTGAGNRPQGGNRPAAAASAPAIVEKGRVSNYDPNRKSYIRVFDTERQRGKTRKQLEKERTAQMMGEDDVFRARKPRRRQQGGAQVRPEVIIIDHAIITTEMVTIKVLAERIGKPVSEIIKKLLQLGIMGTINHEIDFDTAALVAADFGVTLEQQLVQTAEDILFAEDWEDADSELQKRPPVVTIMGHVDHGKTSLLDAIRRTNVSEGEAGGITQHIGAYQVEVNGELVTFLDTPGHEAFTAMRARGAQVTDEVILVVAADDGIMPQTVEAINHSKAAEVPIIVAINKIDRPEANPDRVKQELTEYGLVWEDWGGDTIIVPVSAVTGEGIDTLLEMTLLVAEVQELRANPDRQAKGTIIEARLDRGRGPLATVLVQNGSLRVGNTIVAGTATGRVRALINDKGERVEQALPSQPVEILGFGDVPEAGDVLHVVEAGQLSKQVAEERKNRIKNEQLKNLSKVSLDDLFSQISQGNIKDLNIIVKADVQGSVEAVRSSLEKLSNDEVRVRCIHGGVGGITQADVMLATASSAIIIGFNVRPDTVARTMAENERVDIRLYRIIYNAIEDIELAMKGMLEPIFEEVVTGEAEVREIFRASAVGTIAGCRVMNGSMVRNLGVRLIRDSVVMYEGRMNSLRRFRDDVREVTSGYDCGIALENFNDIKVGDVIEAFTEQEVAR